MQQIPIVVRFPQENKFYNLQVDLDSKLTELVDEMKQHLNYSDQHTIQFSMDQVSCDQKKTFRELGVTKGQVFDAHKIFKGGL